MSVSAICLGRSVWFPRVVTGAALLIGLPLFLRMPLWCDLTLYDMAARNLLAGGVHYRDLFDTNLPGFVWLLTGLRAAFGFGAFQLRCADLLIVAAIVVLVDRLAKRGGATLATRWWAIAGAAVLYPTSTEMNHAQRDVWMALPVAAAVVLRLRRSAEGDRTAGSMFRGAALEGLLWGTAVWIKPHCALMALGVWVLTARRVAGTAQRQWPGLAADLAGNVVGGLVVGLAGIGWLVASGAWPEFWAVVTEWAPEYNAMARREFDDRWHRELFWFPPWSLWLIPTLPLALLSIVDAVPWRGRVTREGPGPVGRFLPSWLWDRNASAQARFARGTLAALWFVWAVQSFVVQRGFAYVHLSELFLMFALWASHRWAMPAFTLLWVTLTSGAWLVADYNPALRERLQSVATDRLVSADGEVEHYLNRHPLLDPERWKLWPGCWHRVGSEREQHRLWDRLQRMKDHEAVISWEEMGEVADFLRAQGVRDGEVIAWHDSPHAVYAVLGVKPGIRYMHVVTIQSITPEAHARIRRELAATAGVARFAVSDLELPTLGLPPAERLRILGPPADPPRDLLPVALQPAYRQQFPFNQPAVFRSRGGLGRYIVHKLTPPLGDE